MPTGTLRYRLITSGTRMRMQPCDAAVPIEDRLAVPWKPTPSPSAMNAALSGLRGSPGGIVWPASSPAHGRLGACQAGLRCLDWTRCRPRGVS